MTLDTIIREYESARKECETTSGLDREAAKRRLAEAYDRIAVLQSETSEELFAKFDVLRDAIDFKGTRWDDLRPFRLLHSLRKDAERLIPDQA
jgi:hypothetical protein